MLSQIQLGLFRTAGTFSALATLTAFTTSGRRTTFTSTLAPLTTTGRTTASTATLTALSTFATTLSTPGSSGRRPLR